MDDKRTSDRCATRRAALTLLGAALIAVTAALRISLVEVRGRSMAPGLVEGDRLLTIPVPPGLPAPGRIVVVEDPARRSHLVIKRVREVLGDRIDVRGDDPAHSTDSRIWGSVRADAVRRIAVARWPAPWRPLPPPPD